MVTKAIKGDVQARVIIALLAVYISWGSTYLAIRIALKDFQPFFMMGIRFLAVGIGLFLFLRVRGAAMPNRRQWGNSLLIGGLMFLGGGGGVAVAEQWIESGLASLVIATTPLWTVMFAGIWKRRPTRLEVIGLAVGLAGIAVLNYENNMRANPIGVAILLLSAISWSFGSAWSRQLSLPAGLMSGAVLMINGGVLLLIVSLLAGENIGGIPAWESVGAILYLAVFGSLIGFSAYNYLLGKVRPALATSYAYVNPVLAVILGVLFAGERITWIGITAMLIILTSVALVILGQKEQ
jgi:drug/metabolite transporter (DMT)-like permease